MNNSKPINFNTNNSIANSLQEMPALPNFNTNIPSSPTPNDFMNSRMNSQKRSEDLIKQFFEESPPFPFHRKFTGEIADASQPSESDEMDD